MSKRKPGRRHCPKSERAALPGDPIRSNIQRRDNATDVAKLQARRLTFLFGLPEATAEIVAELAFAGGQR